MPFSEHRELTVYTYNWLFGKQPGQIDKKYDALFGSVGPRFDLDPKIASYIDALVMPFHLTNINKPK